jgi:hypothetical protein
MVYLRVADGVNDLWLWRWSKNVFKIYTETVKLSGLPSWEFNEALKSSHRQKMRLYETKHSSGSVIVSAFLLLSPLIFSSKGDTEQVCADYDLLKLDFTHIGVHRNFRWRCWSWASINFVFFRTIFENHVINIDITCHWNNILTYMLHESEFL